MKKNKIITKTIEETQTKYYCDVCGELLIKCVYSANVCCSCGGDMCDKCKNIMDYGGDDYPCYQCNSCFEIAKKYDDDFAKLEKEKEIISKKINVEFEEDLIKRKQILQNNYYENN